MTEGALRAAAKRACPGRFAVTVLRAGRSSRAHRFAVLLEVDLAPDPEPAPDPAPDPDPDPDPAPDPDRDPDRGPWTVDRGPRHGSAFLTALDLVDLLSYLHRPGDYYLGSEVAGFRYYSPRHFVGSAVGSLLIGALGLVGPRLLAARRATVALRVGVVLVLLALSFTLSSKSPEPRRAARCA